MNTDDFGLVGKRVREYQVLELVGRGGMGAVYRAQHVLLQQDRAIKVVARRPADDHDFIERFIREARVLARLKDEHLVRLYEFWEERGQLFMALEFLRGESVAERLRRRIRLPLAEAIAIARQAALGLQTAHQGQVVHRDISPDNLQIVKGAGAEVVKVMDFGIAKALEEVHRELTANLFLGKFEYASPEQCGFGLERGETIDWRSDIYSLGVTLFKMATGLLPFEAGTPQGYLVKHATEAAPSPSAMAPSAGLPVELDRLVLRALMKRRQERQQSMAEFIRELDGIPIPEPTLAAAPTVEVATPSPGGALLPSPSPSPEGSSGPTGGLKSGEAFARKYVITSRLGEGGMGVVYRAVDRILNEPVALKVISSRFVEGDAVERLKREVVLARRVAHPNVCRIYDIGESDAGAHYVSMEFVEGRSLGRLLKEKGILPLREGIPLIRQVLEGLSAAHAVNVIHRDLKPDNIMVTPQGHAVILDFGLSLAEDSERVTRAGFVIGTPHYMAPEQVTGQGVDTRCDLYAVGVLLFRMCTGRLPFTSTNTLEILRSQMEEAPPRPTFINAAISPLLESIILKALEKDKAARFATGEAFLNALDAVEPALIRRSTESGRVVRVPRTARKRLGDEDPNEAPTAVQPEVPTSGPANRDRDRDRVRSFLSGAPTAPPVGTEVVSPLPTTVLPEEPLSYEPASTPRPGATRKVPEPGQRHRTAARLPTHPSPARRPPPTSRQVMGGGAALLVVAVAWYVLGSRLPAPAPPVVTLAPSPPGTTPSSGEGTSPSPSGSSPSPLLPSPSTELAPPATATPTARVLPKPTEKPRDQATAPTRLPPTTTPPRPTITAPILPPGTLAYTVLPPTTMLPVPTPAPPPSASPATVAARPAFSPELGVRQALREYEEAFSRLDKDSVRRIYPTILDRNFEGLANFKAYAMRIEVTKIKVDLPRVLVECRVRHSYTSFSGKQEDRTVSEKMVFIAHPDPPWVRVQ